MWEDLAAQGKWQGEIWNRCKDGSVIPHWLTISGVRDEHGAMRHFVGIFSDISVIKASHERIEYMATHDELTGLPNRNLFNGRVKHAIARALRHAERLYVIFVDLDNFKVINDILGHAAGDALLREAARRIGDCVRAEDSVARLGGDEFILLLENTDADRVAAAGKRILDFLSASFRVQGRDLYVTASLGVASFPDDGQDSETLLKNADTAMYKAKERGKNQMQFFSVEMKLHGERRMTIETGIRLALQEEQFALVFQPEVDLHSGRVVAAEVLIRWPRGPLGPLGPDQFIPVAEQAGLIVRITEWVVRHTFAALRAWQDAGLRPVPLFINISPLHLRTGDLVASLATQAGLNGIDPALIGIEITEGAIMDGAEGTTAILHDLRAAGMRIYVDDFGTGYSSLTYLKRYPIDGLKIDRSFVDGIADEPDDQAIATAIIGVARALGITVVAEAVETERQRAELIARGCATGQGFLFHRPMAAEALALLLERHPEPSPAAAPEQEP